MPTAAALTLEGVRARPVDVPMARPLQTSGGTVDSAPLVLLDLRTAEGVTGHAYVFSYTALALAPLVHLIEGLGELLRGRPLAPQDLERALQARFRLLGPQGLTGMAMGGIDAAAWDALAKAAGLPLARLLGGAPRAVPAYNSNGLGIIGARRAPDEARALLEPGFSALKLRLGYPELATDLEVVRAVRDAAGESVALMADYNQSLSVAEAIRRARALDGEGLCWIEEPVAADDYAGHAAVSRAAATPVQTGENWWGSHDMAKCVAAGGSRYVMPDANKIGGVTGWLRASAIAEAAGLPLSSHLYPELSAHLLAVTPTAHWLEFVDWAGPILAQPLAVRGGCVSAPEVPGTGVAWDEDAVARCLAG